MKNIENKVTIDTADLDNPLHKTFSEAIEAHNRVAKYYNNRPPYIPDFFRIASEKLQISKETTLLDLCCGTGVLASGFSPYAGKIYGVDGSTEMLEHSVKKDNIFYFNNDVNTGNLSLPHKVSHILIGDAVWWLKSNMLLNIINSNVKNSGKILVTHTILKHSEHTTFNAVKKINASYKKNFVDIDFTGNETLKKCHYKRLGTIKTTANFHFSIEFLIMNQLSYAYRDFFETTHDNIEQYKSDMSNALSPFLKNGKLSGALINLAIVYAPINII